MHRLFTDIIGKFFDAVAPGRALLVGSGRTTEEQLILLQQKSGAFDVADPWPNTTLRNSIQQFDLHHCLHAMHGLHAIPLLPPADVAILDGDSNWFTVYHELQLLFARAVETGHPAPLVFVHEAAWPYGRRDRYDEPGRIPERQEYECRGIFPGRSSLADEGVNGRSFNAVHEGGPANGVLTAVEDFVAGWPHPIMMHVLPFFGGLAILVPQARATDKVAAALDELFAPAALLSICVALEQDRSALCADLATHRLKLAQRSEALVKARARIIELEQALAGASQD